MAIQEFANHILYLAGEKNIPITNLALQKIMYFTLRNSSDYIDKALQKEIYSERFLVWRYGPVILSQYDRFSNFGSEPIMGNFNEEKKYVALNDLIYFLLGTDVFKMVNASHTHPFWKKNQNKIVFGRSNVEYPLEEVLISA